ncbi:MAG: NAD(P)/FAD-dependent oxidoreductase [Nitrospinae bacterium]|nr:NAD(P)/FAD-dependent oxidoreductase [Nitrospinota bacterium]
MKVAVIGGGAAGFFAALGVKKNYPDSEVTIFERGQTPLAKVRISGGGRCNLTNNCPTIKELSAAYPRGAKMLKKAFGTFNNIDTIKWFQSRGIPLLIEDDGRVFPASETSETVIDYFLRQAKRLEIALILGEEVKNITLLNDKLELEFVGGRIPPTTFDKVIVTTGGSPKREGLVWLEKLGHKIVDPVPSLFTLRLPAERITKLTGVAVDNTLVSIQGTNIEAEGSLLITHWGMSGPAILKLSSFGARLLSEKDYEVNLRLNWVGVRNNDLVVKTLQDIIDEHSNKLLLNFRPYSLPERLWHYLLKKSDFPANKKWGEIGKKGINKIANILTNDIYSVKGTANFKEEFVTCGGVSLESVDSKTMQSKACPNLYFAGEVLDIDGITGGYNFQAAWTTGYIASQLK